MDFRKQVEDLLDELRTIEEASSYATFGWLPRFTKMVLSRLDEMEAASAQ